MSGARGSLGRWLPTLILTGLLVALFVMDTLPAWAERDALRAERRATEAEVESMRADLRRDEAWLRAAEDGDAYVIERERDRLLRSPDLPGPTYRVAERPADPASDEDAALDLEPPADPR